MEKWIELYNNGFSTVKIAEQFGTKAANVHYFLKKSNVKIRSNKQNSRKYIVDDNFFEVIDTEEKAYWFGFIYADGYVLTDTSIVGISLHSRDKCHLEKAKASLSATYTVRDYKSNNCYGGEVNYSRLTVRSDKLKSDLIKNGCVPKKSLILAFPNDSVVPKHLKWHFIRGYFDGDGSLTSTRDTKWNIKICGTSGFLSDLSNFAFGQKTGISKDNRNEKDTCILTVSGKDKLKMFVDNMYDNSTIFLDRKYEKYKRYLKLTGRLSE
jgi:hypothetical protein